MQIMKINSRRLVQCFSFLCLIAIALCFPLPAEADILIVNTVDDDDDGVCDSAHCSLREAIREANTNPGPDTIHFDIPGPTPHHILLCSLLPVLTDNGTILDGTSEPDYSGTPVVMIEPAFVPTGPPVLTFLSPCNPPFVGLQIEADDIEVQGLGMGNFRYYSLTLYPPVAGAIVINSGSHALIHHNYLGIHPSGQSFGNDVGVIINSSVHLIKDNVISGNYAGIYDMKGHNTFIGNLIGTDPTGSFSVSNEIGIWTNFNATHDMIGGVTAGEGNLVSGNNYVGVYLQTDNNTVLGNQLGTNLTGDAAIPNGYGVEIYGGSDNTIGGTAPGQGNLISGNVNMGVSIHCSAGGNVVNGNLIGTDISGTQPIGNRMGVGIAGGPNMIGGELPGDGNVIAFNTDVGVGLADPTLLQRIIRNEIHSNGVGVWIRTTFAGWPEQIPISRNQIHDNIDLGIDLWPQGVTPNDPGDGDAGPNTLLNFPVLTSVSTTMAVGNACPNCRIEVFLADGDPSGHGEGEVFLDFGTADGAGNFNIPIQNVAACDPITATAIDGAGNTSEFSQNVYAGCVTVTPLLTLPLGLGLMFIGGISAFVVGRRSGSPPVRQTLAGVLGGGIVAVCGLIAVNALPNMQFSPFDQPETEMTSNAYMPSCEAYFGDAEIMPQSGTVFAPDEEPIFSWPSLPESFEGEIRWRVVLSRLDGSELTQITTQNEIGFSSFGIGGELSGVYHWNLTGETLNADTGAWEPLCEGGPHYIFEIGPPQQSSVPEESSELVEEPSTSLEMCVYTALYNVNCRESDYPESLLIGELLEGEMAELMALNPTFSHGKFRLPNQEQCWIWLGLLDGPENPYEACGVPVIEPPIEPTLTCQTDMDQEACEAAGGTWSTSATRAPECICPE